jgi:hypothetical protein
MTIRVGALAEGEASGEAIELPGVPAADEPLAPGAAVPELPLHAANAKAVIAPRVAIRPMR